MENEVDEVVKQFILKIGGYEPSTVRERMLCAVVPAVMRENPQTPDEIAKDVVSVTDAILKEAGLE